MSMPLRADGRSNERRAGLWPGWMDNIGVVCYDLLDVQIACRVSHAAFLRDD